MASLVSFHYRPGTSLLHRARPELKLILYLGLNVLLAMLGLGRLGLAALLLTSFSLALGISPLALLRELRLFFWVLVLSYISRTHLNASSHIELSQLPFLDRLAWNLPSLPFDAQGARDSLRFLLHLVTAIISTHMLLASTSAHDLQDGLYRIFRVLGRRRSWKISTMLRIMLMALPTLGDEARSAALSLKLRGLAFRRQPFRYTRAMGLSLLRAVDRLTDGYSRSLIIRGWSENGPAESPPPRRRSAKTGPRPGSRT